MAILNLILKEFYNGKSNFVEPQILHASKTQLKNSDLGFSNRWRLFCFVEKTFLEPFHVIFVGHGANETAAATVTISYCNQSGMFCFNRVLTEVSHSEQIFTMNPVQTSSSFLMIEFIQIDCHKLWTKEK